MCIHAVHHARHNLLSTMHDMHVTCMHAAIQSCACRDSYMHVTYIHAYMLTCMQLLHAQNLQNTCSVPLVLHACTLHMHVTEACTMRNCHNMHARCACYMYNIPSRACLLYCGSLKKTQLNGCGPSNEVCTDFL